MIAQQNFPAYDVNEYLTPWGASVVFEDKGTPVFAMVGESSNNDGDPTTVTIYTEAPIVAFGQVHRDDVTMKSTFFHVTDDDGSMEPITESEALEIYRKQFIKSI